MDNLLGSRVIPRWSYHCPKDLSSVLKILDKYKDQCKILAGCTDIIPAARRGVGVFSDKMHAVDITHIEELKFIKKREDLIRIGAATKLGEIEFSQTIKTYAPLLANAVSEMASLQVRNSGTIGGNLGTASPAADTAPPLLALNAMLRIKNKYNEKEVKLENFFTAPGQTILKPEEIISEIYFPAMKTDEKSCWIKLGRRNVFTLSLVSVAVWVKFKVRIVKEIRIALGAVAATPMRAKNTEEYFIGKEINEEVIANGSKIIASEVNPISDARAGAAYRKDMVCTLTRRALIKCLD